MMNPPFQLRRTNPADAPAEDLDPSKLSLMKPPRGDDHRMKLMECG